ncbi:MAG TPA: ATP-binding protein [Streptosporangiaceae bacterium]|nr:ATP-binding protein [Streptosporangiaceae bacterium]
MRVAFAGKGGSGKTTLSSLFIRYLADQGLPVVAIDADINQHLAEVLDVGGQPPALGARLAEIKEYLRGGNLRISSAAAMIKTTPPGRGSRLLQPGGADPVHALAVGTPCGARLMATGPFDDDDIGVACYHSKTGAVELYLNHLVDRPGEYVVVDCMAGADSFASGLFTRFDLTFLVCEPTRKGVGVWRQWAGYAADYDVPLAVVANKIQGEEDIAFLREHVGGALLACFGHAPAVRAMEQGRPFSLGDLGQDARAALAALRQAADARARDWAKLTGQAAEFHLRNAAAWANAAVGEDLAGQVDPDFVMGPQALPMAGGDQVTGRVLA